MALTVDIKKKLKGFTLETAFNVDGQTMGLLGGSGSGKSMTLRCIAGVVCPDEGRIALNGQVWFDSAARVNLPPQRRRVGYLFQHYALFPHMTVAQNLACGIGGAEKADAVRLALSQFYLEGLGGRYPAQLSGGQQQRAALARMLLSKPSVLLLDEPFAALDAYLRGEMVREVADILSSFSGPAIVVSHDRDEIYHLCDSVAVYQNGALDTVGRLQEVFQRPVTRTAAVLTGCRNVLDASPAGSQSILVKGWNLKLETAYKIGPEINAVGVRARHFAQAQQNDKNQLRCTLVSAVESPFDMAVYLKPVGGCLLLCWKTDKNTFQKVSDKTEIVLSVSPSAVLPLKG